MVACTFGLAHVRAPVAIACCARGGEAPHRCWTGRGEARGYAENAMKGRLGGQRPARGSGKARDRWLPVVYTQRHCRASNRRLWSTAGPLSVTSWELLAADKSSASSLPLVPFQPVPISWPPLRTCVIVPFCSWPWAWWSTSSSRASSSARCPSRCRRASSPCCRWGWGRVERVASTFSTGVFVGPARELCTGSVEADAAGGAVCVKPMLQMGVGGGTDPECCGKPNCRGRRNATCNIAVTPVFARPPRTALPSLPLPQRCAPVRAVPCRSAASTWPRWTCRTSPACRTTSCCCSGCEASSPWSSGAWVGAREPGAS